MNMSYDSKTCSENMKEKPGSLSEKEKDHIKKRQKITKKEKHALNGVKASDFVYICWRKSHKIRII